MGSAGPMDSRFVSLDVVRGIAVMGILLMNIVAFAMPPGAYFTPIAYGGDSPADIAVWATNFVFSDGKMRGLFSVLFGASMLIVIQSAEAKDENPALTHYSRMSWLLFFGALHAYAIWHGDILMLYAIIGSIAFFFRKMETHRLVVLGLILIVMHAILFGLLTWSLWMLREAAAAPGADAELIRQWTEFEAQFGPIPPDKLAEDLARYRGDYVGILSYRLGPGITEPIMANFTAAIETLGLMLLGMAGLKSGFLTGQWERAAYVRCIKIGYLIGLPLMMALAFGIIASGFDPITAFALDFTGQVLVNPAIILAHAALILYWVKSSAGSAFMDRVAAVGRAAFTNYLGTSIVCTTIFYGYGFGLYGELSRPALYIVVLGVWALMLLWSKPWLDRFRYGPLEWLWRTLARREIQPIRK
ncbi:DUF418 domain-containing protein [Parasphingopyxis sp.]|uniref:DUF418 domain-containing protein n=1 Tax=Parasphingopyxis sp. TaxID=1920299 RepID=UPI0026399D5F|nr:DUF418 domain-containing protein [Parasphingopyxis sp.]